MDIAPYNRAPSIVVIGGGHAGGVLVQNLIDAGLGASTTLIGEEGSLPYQRPPLSKKFLMGDITPDSLLLRPRVYYEEHGVRVLTGCSAENIQTDQSLVGLSSGQSIGFDQLALTTGARPRGLNVVGTDLKGVSCLRTVADVEKIRQRFLTAKRIAVVGGGFIGLEVAAIARALGLEVLVIGTQDRLMARAVSPIISDFFLQQHRSRGVEFIFNTAVDAFTGENGFLRRIHYGDKTSDADLAIVGIGVVPNEELAREAGIDCNNGIVVDEQARTSIKNIVAAGDCTTHFNSELDRWLRLESVHNAIEQAKTAAATIIGKARPYNQIPWFWSDQFEFKLQMAGSLHNTDDFILRGNLDEGSFAVFHFLGEALKAVESVNRPADFLVGRQFLNLQGIKCKDAIIDPNSDLKRLVLDYKKSLST